MSTVTNTTDTAQILEFACRWHKFGGGPAEDILVGFGVSEHVFFRRVISALDSSAAHDIDDATRQSVLTVAQQRIDKPSR